MRTQVVSLLLLIGAVFGGLALAQQGQQVTRGVPAGPVSISIGQSLADVTGILQQRGIEFHEGGFAFATGDPDVSNLRFALDENHTVVCAFFCKSKQSITGLSMVFFPQLKHARLDETWISVTSLVLFPDTSYAVHFAKPLTRDQLREAEANRPKSVYPNGTTDGSKNP